MLQPVTHSVDCLDNIFRSAHSLKLVSQSFHVRFDDVVVDRSVMPPQKLQQLLLVIDFGRISQKVRQQPIFSRRQLDRSTAIRGDTRVLVDFQPFKNQEWTLEFSPTPGDGFDASAQLA